MRDALESVGLRPLMERSEGRREVAIGLIDGPVAADHPDLEASRVRAVGAEAGQACSTRDRAACLHGTFVAGVLVGRRGSVAPAICPACTLLVRPIFAETTELPLEMPSASPAELATAITDCVAAGASVVNLSLALAHPSLNAERALQAALDGALRRGVIIVAAAGNQGVVGSSAITRYPWVIPVVASNFDGRPLGECNLSRSIGRNGLSASGDRVTSLGAAGEPLTFGGTSAAAPFVTGAIALLWSEFPAASAVAIKYALLRGSGGHRTSIAPPLLDAWAAYQGLAGMEGARRAS